MFLIPQRLPYAEFLAETMPVSLIFIFRAPPLSYVSNIYYLPFNAVVWFCAIVLVVVCTTLIYIVYKYSNEENTNLTSSDFVLYAMGTVCQMGTQMVPKTSSGKIATVIKRSIFQIEANLVLFTVFHFVYNCSTFFV